MEDMLKVTAGVLVAAMLTVILQGQGKGYVTLLIVAVVAMGACIAFSYIKPIITFLDRLQDVSSLKNESLTILLKAVGIGLLNEFCGAICADTGNTSLAKMLNLVSTVAIMWISLPVLEQIMELITDVLEGI